MAGILHKLCNSIGLFVGVQAVASVFVVFILQEHFIPFECDGGKFIQLAGVLIIPASVMPIFWNGGRFTLRPLVIIHQLGQYSSCTASIARIVAFFRTKIVVGVGLIPFGGN